jgi:hypothetical protein
MKLRSTRVVSMARTNTRSPFFRDRERDRDCAITKALRQNECIGRRAEPMRGLHQISKEIAARTEKRKIDDAFEVDSWVELVSTMECLRPN